MLRTVKVGDILIVYPYKEKVKVIVVIAKKFILKESDERYWLKDYWRKKHGIILPMAFRIVTCKFTTTYKEYDYPLYRKCIRKPFRQKKLKKRWKNEREAILKAKINFKKRKGGEMDDNKGNWHPPSDYTMYQMGF